jgi:hypothetical protein
MQALKIKIAHCKKSKVRNCKEKAKRLNSIFLLIDFFKKIILLPFCDRLDKSHTVEI